MTKAETIKLLAVLRAAYPNQTITEETVDVYCGMLADLDAEAATQGVKALLAESRFFPTISEIRAAALRDNHAIASGLVAWGEVMAAVKRVGSYATPEWSSETVAKAVRAIGWESICRCEMEQLNTLRSQFIRTFDAYHGHATRERNIGSLTGESTPERLPTGTDGGMQRLANVVPIRRQQ